MADDPIKEAEKRGYARGYAAGRRRHDLDQSRAQIAQARENFRERAFLAALPSCIDAQGWKRGDTPITSLADRVRLAWETADEAVKGSRL